MTAPTAVAEATVSKYTCQVRNARTIFVRARACPDRSVRVTTGIPAHDARRKSGHSRTDRLTMCLLHDCRLGGYLLTDFCLMQQDARHELCGARLTRGHAVPAWPGNRTQYLRPPRAGAFQLSEGGCGRAAGQRQRAYGRYPSFLFPRAGDTAHKTRGLTWMRRDKGSTRAEGTELKPKCYPR